MVKPTTPESSAVVLGSASGTYPDTEEEDFDQDYPVIGPQPSNSDQWKQPVRVASVGDITIATALNDGDTLDGVTLADGDRVLVAEQSDASENGLYIVDDTPYRASDMDDGAEVLGTWVYVIDGAEYGGTSWHVIDTTEPTVDTDDINWEQTAAGAIAAADVSYDNTYSGLVAADVQDAIDELAAAPGGSSPLTTKGDLHTYDTADARLPVGTDDYVLTADSAEALGVKWAASSAGFSDPMTTRGDIIVRASGGTDRLALGANGYVLTSDGTDVAWAAAGGGGTWPPLDQYTLDATYGDHFTAASLDAKWTRRGYASETLQVGYNATWMRLSPNGRAAGDGYFQTDATGDGTWACKLIFRGFAGVSQAFGIGFISSAGTGVSTVIYFNPSGPLFINVTTYSSYGGTYVEPGSTTTNPNLQYIDVINRRPTTSTEIPLWLYVRRSGTNYYFAYSLDGEIWSAESSALASAHTPDRLGLMHGPLGNISGTSLTRIDVDWFNKIA